LFKIETVVGLWISNDLRMFFMTDEELLVDLICARYREELYSYYLDTDPELNFDLFENIANCFKIFTTNNRSQEISKVLLALMHSEVEQSVVDVINACIAFESNE